MELMYQILDLRRVTPYFFLHQTGVKERWIGKQILDVFLKEFTSMPQEYYVSFLLPVQGHLLTSFSQEQSNRKWKNTCERSKGFSFMHT